MTRDSSSARALADGDDLLSAFGGKPLGATVMRVGNADGIAVNLEMLDQFRHRLLGHLSAFGEQAYGRSGVVEVLEDRTMDWAHHPVSSLGQPGNGEVVERYERLSHQDSEVGRTFGTGQLRYASRHSTRALSILEIWTSYLSILAQLNGSRWELTRSPC